MGKHIKKTMQVRETTITIEEPLAIPRIEDDGPPMVEDAEPDKKAVMMWVSPDYHRKIKTLRVELDRPMQDLGEEMIGLLLEKYSAVMDT